MTPDELMRRLAVVAEYLTHVRFVEISNRIYSNPDLESALDACDPTIPFQEAA